jgi:2-polyprenyl-6-methoxyphenol hydroxylase-like FAD-dependent oxidoreductase
MSDVLIIGGGPNGLLLAGELALAGVRATVLERFAERPTMPKANGLVGRVVQAMDHRGLYERLSGSTTPPVPMPGFQFGALPLDLSTMEHSLYALPVPQRRLEELLEDRARELGVDLRRGHELRAVHQDDDRVTAEIDGPDGPYELAAKYLVGADGGRSVVRKQCGIGFPGITDDGFVSRTGQVEIAAPVAVGTGELDVPGLGRLRPATFTRTDTGMFAYGMFQPGRYRVSVFEWGAEPATEHDDIPLAELRDAVNRVLGTDLPMSETMTGATTGALRRTVGVNSRQADRYRHGRVFLAGDAAHVHSGVGGPGLNLGMQDVLNLGWKLAAAVGGWAPPGLLDTYESERQPVGLRVIMHTRAQLALLQPGPNVTALRELMTELLHDRATARHLADLMAGADIRYATTDPHPMAGRWVPDLTLHDGRRIAELLRPARPILLNLAGRKDIADAAAGWADRVDVVTARADTPVAAVLVRPDSYVAWATDDSADGLRDALGMWFGQDGPRRSRTR